MSTTDFARWVRRFDNAADRMRRRVDGMYRGTWWHEYELERAEREAAARESMKRLEDAMRRMEQAAAPAPKSDPATDALKDIAYDCGTLEAAQRRAKEALAAAKGGR